MMGLNLAYRDLLLSVLLVLFALIMLAKPTDPKDLLQPPGSLFVYTSWADTGGDVDSWMLAPDMIKPIGYDNKDSVTCNLVKDDLGYDKDPIGYNYENIFCRDTPDGEYIINMHAFGVKTFPLTVNIQVAMTVDGRNQLLFEEKIVLNSPKDEVTVIRFTIKDNKIVPGSVHHTFISLFKMS